MRSAPRPPARESTAGTHPQLLPSVRRPPLSIPLELAQQLVYGAEEYARGLGFEPHPDDAAAKGPPGQVGGYERDYVRAQRQATLCRQGP